MKKEYAEANNKCTVENENHRSLLQFKKQTSIYQLLTVYTP